MSEALNIAEKLFHDAGGLDPHVAARHIGTALDGADDGELFLEYRESEAISLEDGRIRSASFDTRRGFGLRAVLGEAAYYAHAGELSDAALARAAQNHQSRQGQRTWHDRGRPGGFRRRAVWRAEPAGRNAVRHPAPVCWPKSMPMPRGADSRVTQVMASIAGEWQVVEIIRADGSRVADLRPLVRLNVSVVLAQDGPPRIRQPWRRRPVPPTLPLSNPPTGRPRCMRRCARPRSTWKASPPRPAKWPVVLGAGWPGILLHEAIGHGLEGDFNRKQTSAFAGLMGSRIAAKGVTVVDDGTIPRPPRLAQPSDDEGTPTSRTTLIRGRRAGRLPCRTVRTPA